MCATPRAWADLRPRRSLLVCFNVSPVVEQLVGYEWYLTRGWLLARMRLEHFPGGSYVSDLRPVQRAAHAQAQEPAHPLGLRLGQHPARPLARGPGDPRRGGVLPPARGLLRHPRQRDEAVLGRDPPEADPGRVQLRDTSWYDQIESGDRPGDRQGA